MGDTNRDPSMEEILASIKRVIAEEAPPPPQRAPRAARPQPEEEDVLELSNPVSAGPALLSEDAAEASRTRLASLAEMRRQGESSASAGEGPMEAMVREMLKPMLKDWLDAHLPEIVEELVTREIARITTGKDI